MRLTNGRTETLLTAHRTQLSAHAFISASGREFSVFDARTQDSGNVSYGVEIEGRRFFVKTAGSPAVTGTALSHAERVALLRNATQLHRTIHHDVLAVLRNVVEAQDGPLLVHDWIEGELLGAAREQRTDPASAFQRFRRLPVPAVLKALDEIIDLHRHLASRGWIAVDFYDGSLLYDFQTGMLHVIDLDNYHFGPFVNRVGRMFGSTRFMAPEEFELGAPIDQRTNVFMLGRTVLELLSDSTRPVAFRGPAELLAVARRATSLQPDDRHASVGEFAADWTAARSPLSVQ
jgi:hypothetical protein